eukprot:symbB.v1.2.006296.t1/scaffold375.1/size220138/14
MLVWSVLEEELGGHAPNSPYDDGEETHLGVFRLAPGSLHRRMDLILSRREHLPLVLLNWTGSGLFLRELHRLASYKGLKISSTQLLARDANGAGVQVPVTEEADIFEALGLTYRPPEQRELDDSLMRFVQACKPGQPALKRQKSESASSSMNTSMGMEVQDSPKAPRPQAEKKPEDPEARERREEFQRLDEQLEKFKENLRTLSEHLSKVMGTDVGIETLDADIIAALLEDKESEKRQKQEQLIQLREEVAELRHHAVEAEAVEAVIPSATEQPKRNEAGEGTAAPVQTKRNSVVATRQRRNSQVDALEDLQKDVDPELMQQLLAAQGETLNIQEQLNSIEDLITVVRSKGQNLSSQEKEQLKEPGNAPKESDRKPQELFGGPDPKKDQSAEATELREEKKKIRALEKQVGEKRDEWNSIDGAAKALRGLAEGNMTQGEIAKKVRIVKAAYVRTGDIEDTGSGSTELGTLQAAAAMARTAERRRNSDATVHVGLDLRLVAGVALQLLQLEALPRLGAPQEVQGIVHLQWRLMNFKMYLQLQLHQLQQLHQLRQLQQHLDSQILQETHGGNVAEAVVL